VGFNGHGSIKPLSVFVRQEYIIWRDDNILELLFLLFLETLATTPSRDRRYEWWIETAEAFSGEIFIAVCNGEHVEQIDLASAAMWGALRQL
jgi:hypothetical protein